MGKAARRKQQRQLFSGAGQTALRRIGIYAEASERVAPGMVAKLRSYVTSHLGTADPAVVAVSGGEEYATVVQPLAMRCAERVMRYKVGAPPLAAWVTAVYAASDALSLAVWQTTQQIIAFDPDLAAALIASDSDAIPMSVFEQMPIWAFYVCVPPGDDGLPPFGVWGFFVHFTNEPTEDGGSEPYLMLTFDSTSASIETGIERGGAAERSRERWRSIDRSVEGCPVMVLQQVAVPIRRGTMTLDEAAAAATEHLKRSTQTTTGEPDPAFLDADLLHGKIAIALRLLLYVVTPEPDIAVRNDLARTWPQAASVVSVAKPTPPTATEWTAGLRVGALLGAETTASNGASSGTSTGPGRSSPRPHLRRGHFARRWYGPLNSTQRQTRVVWIPPTFVSGTSSGVGPVVRGVTNDSDLVAPLS